MQTQPNLFTRDDTFLGVCAGLGEDFGFNPTWLRAVLAVMLLWQPIAVFAIYGALGLLVAGSRWLYPKARQADATATVTAIREDRATEQPQVREPETFEMAEAA